MNKLIIIFAVITGSALLSSGCNSKNIKPIDSGEKIGVVLMHGKGGTTRWVDPLASSLRSAGVKVVTPDMAWHRNRIYDKTFDQAMAEINSHVNSMKSNGIQSVYVAGHSLGAVASAGYAARYNDINGIILLAPGHFVAFPGFHRRFVDDLEIAESMIATGKGDEKHSFGDINNKKRATRYITANIFYSWFSDSGPAEFVSNMTNVKGDIPILYVAGSQDRIGQTKNREYAFDEAPAHPNSQFTIIESNHLDVPRKADEVTIEWLRNL
jgi:esterase/lipase